MQKVLMIVLAGTLAVGSVLRAQSPSAADLFQEALAHEEVKGDLDKAIATYQAILTRFAADRPVAARALVHLARCYERLGRPEAAATYDRVIRDYADQAAPASEARTRRASLVRHAAGESEAALVERQQVWAGDEVNLQGRPSADGRYLAFLDHSNGKSNVAIRDLRTGQNRRLTSAVSGESGGAEPPAVSPDGGSVAYGWSTDAETFVRIIGTDGGKPKSFLMPFASGVEDLTWSPDGRRLAAVLFNKDRTQQIALIDAATGAVTQLQSTGLRYPWLGGFSPDGRFLAYSARPAKALPDDTSADVYAISLDGPQEWSVVEGAGDDKNPVWTPDGKAIVFVSDRSGANGLWAVRVQDGKPAGALREVRPDIGPAVSLGFSRDGTLLYGLEGTARDVFVASVDPDHLRVTAPPRLLSDRFAGLNAAPQWSPNGTAVAFLRGSDRWSQTIVVRSMPDGVERTLPTRIVDAFFIMSHGWSWFPDSRSLLIRDKHPSHERRAVVRRVNVQTGEETVLFEAGEWDVWSPVKLSPDGRSVYYTSFARDVTRGINQLRLMKRDLASGQETELLQRETGFYSFYGLMVSPDASRLVFLESVGAGPRTLVTLDAAGGQPQELYPSGSAPARPSANVGAWMRTWTPDGRFIITKTRDGAVWAFPTGPGEPRKLDWPLPVVGDLSPDGRHTVYTVGKQTRELRTIQNLLSRIPAAD
jgi:TolB protein